MVSRRYEKEKLNEIAKGPTIAALPRVHRSAAPDIGESPPDGPDGSTESSLTAIACWRE
jgi:hypothetical protein